jgi:predicted SprT family Zn-dependent metalloprotease
MKEEFEEVELVCEVCGKKVKRVRRKSDSEKKFLCQLCGKKLTETR